MLSTRKNSSSFYILFISNIAYKFAWQQDARHATAGPQGFDQVSISGSPLVKCLVVYLQTCEVDSWSPHSTSPHPQYVATWCCKFLLFRRSAKVYQTSGQNIINILGTSWSLCHWGYFVFGQNMALVPGPITTTTDFRHTEAVAPPSFFVAIVLIKYFNNVCVCVMCY